jgi:peptide/nickel transport system substrate-binding protein
MKRFKTRRLATLLACVTVALAGASLAQGYAEAPMLAERVAAGELPSVDERLPVNPLVMEPFEEIGQYGGVFHRAITDDTTQLISIVGTIMEPLVWWTYPDPFAGPITPNVAESFEINDDLTEMVVHLREGMRWSDGHPLTADDVMFFWQDVMLNEDAPQSAYDQFYLAIRGLIPAIERVDDHTVRFTWTEPNYFILEGFASMREAAWPMHAMAEFHPDHNPDATWDDWTANSGYIGPRGRVTLGAFYLTGWDTGVSVTTERNPYYFKVDPEGNQLPYLDGILYNVIADRQVIALEIASGNIHGEGRFTGLEHLPVWAEQIERGAPIEIKWIPDATGMVIYWNHDAPDAAKREFLRDTDVRRALSVAVDRQTIGEVLWLEVLTPSSFNFAPGHPYVSEEHARRYTDYDAELARDLLDGAGYLDRNGDGWRQFEDGSRIELVIDVLATNRLYVDSLEMIQEYFADVGIGLVMNPMDQARMGSARFEGAFDGFVWNFDGIELPLIVAHLWVPRSDATPFWHRNVSRDGPYADWYAEIIELMNRATEMPDEDRFDLMERASDLFADHVPGLHLGGYDRPYAVSTRIGNWPPVIRRVTEFGGWIGTQRFEQLFFRE